MRKMVHMMSHRSAAPVTVWRQVSKRSMVAEHVPGRKLPISTIFWCSLRYASVCKKIKGARWGSSTTVSTNTTCTLSQVHRKTAPQTFVCSVGIEGIVTFFSTMEWSHSGSIHYNYKHLVYFCVGCIAFVLDSLCCR